MWKTQPAKKGIPGIHHRGYRGQQSVNFQGGVINLVDWRHGASLAALSFFAIIGITSAHGQVDVSQSTHLKSADERDLSRVNSVSVERYRTLTGQATPNSVRANMLIHVLTTPKPNSGDYLLLWHGVALDATSTDHLPVSSNSPGTYHEQYGPPRTSRALALVHLAMFEAVNQLTGERYKSILQVNAAPPTTSDADVTEGAAIVEAAYQTLEWLYPGLNNASLVGRETLGKTPLDCQEGGDQFSLSFYYLCSLQKLNGGNATDSPSVIAGRAFGQEVVASLIAARGADGSDQVEPTFNVDFVPAHPAVAGVYPVYQWQPDPVSQLQFALGANWNRVKPFSLNWSGEERIPEDKSALVRYRLTEIKPEQWPSYGTVKKFGGEPRLTTGDMSGADHPFEYYIAKFWAYDASAGLCAPVRLYNQIADEYLLQKVLPAATRARERFDVVDEARYYALINLAMADAAIAAWDNKYHFQLTRPVTAIRTSDQEKMTAIAGISNAHIEALNEHLDSSLPPGPAGTPAPGTPASVAAELWYPLGAQNTNAATPYNITPPFPAYPSGHATFGGALFGILRQYQPKDDNTPFRFQSDEFNGFNVDAYNFTRCKDGDNKNPTFCQPDGRLFTLDCAERENADSRVFMGVHWSFDADDGIEVGNQVAWKTWNGVLQLQQKSEPPTPFDQFYEHVTNRSDVQRKNFEPLTAAMRKSLICPGMVYQAGVLEGFDSGSEVAK